MLGLLFFMKGNTMDSKAKKYMTLGEVYNKLGIFNKESDLEHGINPFQPVTEPVSGADSDDFSREIYTNRSEILDQANDIVNGTRNSSYGQPEDNFQLIADYWSMYLVRKGKMNDVLSNEDVTVMMILLKIARLGGEGTEDCFVDIAGYAACGGEIHSKNAISNELTGSSSS